MLDEIDQFQYMLAEKLGMTVAELGERMSSREYVHWYAFYEWRNALAEVHGGSNGSESRSQGT